MQLNRWKRSTFVLALVVMVAVAAVAVDGQYNFAAAMFIVGALAVFVMEYPKEKPHMIEHRNLAGDILYPGMRIVVEVDPNSEAVGAYAGEHGTVYGFVYKYGTVYVETILDNFTDERVLLYVFEVMSE